MSISSFFEDCKKVFSSCKLSCNEVYVPTVCIIGPYRFYFYSHEPNEPPHMHVDRDGLSAKFWLEHPSLAGNWGFREKELNKLRMLITNNQKNFLGKWYEYFGS